jgi:perosamine synthetase
MASRPEIAPGSLAPSGVVPLSVPSIGEREIELVTSALRDGWVSSAGPYVDRFEDTAREIVGGGHAVAVATGTAALHVGLLLAGVKPGDEVLVSTLTFIASANAIAYCDAHPVLIDAEPDYWQISPDRVREFLEERCTTEGGRLVNRRTGRRVAAVMPVHIMGHPFDADAIVELCRRFELPMIEDAAEGLGASYRGTPLGRFGDAAALSFNGNKIVTAGGGGILLTPNQAWADRASYLTTTAKDDPVEYIHGEVGFNYRLTSLQAAVGTAQLQRLGEFVEAKRRIAAVYARELDGLPGLTLMPEAPWAQSSFWLYTIRVAGGSRPLLHGLREAGIQSRPLWQPMHHSRAHGESELVGGEVADSLHAEALSLPCSTSLTDDDQNRVIEAVRRFLEA